SHAPCYILLPYTTLFRSVCIVFRNDTAIASTGFTTITTFPLTLRFLSSASVDNAEITLYNSPATTSPRSLGANVNVPDDSLSVTDSIYSSLSFICLIGFDYPVLFTYI